MYLIYLHCTVAPNLTHSAAPGMIVGNVGQVSIGLSCIVSVVENIASILYYFTWMRNGLRILPNNRIMVCIFIASLLHRFVCPLHSCVCRYTVVSVRVETGSKALTRMTHIGLDCMI